MVEIFEDLLNHTLKSERDDKSSGANHTGPHVPNRKD